MPVQDDPFDTILSLEDDFYKEGYDLGVSDGDHAGLVEGRLFGLEKGFEKFAAMGALHGRATIWAGRLPDKSSYQGVAKEQSREVRTRAGLEQPSEQEQSADSSQARSNGHVPRLQETARLETHVRTLYALAEPGSLSTENNEESVSEFDDRLKRAEGKIKIVEKLTGERIHEEASDKSLRGEHRSLPLDITTRNGEDGNIEDWSSLHARH